MQLCATLKFLDPAALKIANRHADLIELRQPSPRLFELCRRPVILKLDQLDQVQLDLQPAYIDLPSTASPEDFAYIGKHYPQIKRICSYHNFDETPDLAPILEQMQQCPAEVYKIATYANSICDSLRMVRLVQQTGILGLCMGQLGELTRILSPLSGTPWTYAPPSNLHKTAPGQLLLAELLGIYNFRAHSPKTALYGLIGDPVSQSPSHRMHNFTFHHLGLDALYVKMPVKPDELADFFPLCRAVGFKGLSVTIPHKEQIAPYLDRYDEKAINTVRFSDQIEGWNTDGLGALNAIEKRLAIAGKKITILGAGGSAAGIAREALRRGASVTICNRTFSRAQALAEQLAITPLALDAVSAQPYDVLINCTSSGLPIAADQLLPNRLVMDITFGKSPLLQAAETKNCQIIDGMELFIGQAAYQYTKWFGEPIRK